MNTRRAPRLETVRWRWALHIALSSGGLLLLSGCAAAANPGVAHGNDVPGFWLRLWQGPILPVTFVVSLFTDGVGVYATRNSGHLYDLDFVLGAGGLSAPGFLTRKNRAGAPRNTA